MITLHVNGADHQLEVDPETPLLWVLREQLGLTGTKYCCGIGECGACTVLVNGRTALSCSLPVREAVGRDIVTIEGFQGPLAEALRRAWLEQDVVQCGYCQPAQILTAAVLLRKNPQPDDSLIDAGMAGVLCRCGTYQAVRQAIYQAAREYVLMV
ncbi:MAG: (2Fe-2S)-binding protein [Deltaproteobacteria bacterium]|nr:(2Fe-2S)-binding protein [Deltaproteobacteria bacterium]